MTVRPIRRLATGIALAALSMSVLSACGGDSAKPSLNWYVNPDGQDTLNALAKRCSTNEYTIKVQLLPSSATDQRTQLARRLAAEDSSTDLMSLDPVFVAEFANAKWLLPFEGEQADQVLDSDVLKGAAETATWDDEVVAAPQWANTQVLWYRKSLAKAAGLDMNQPVTWDQIIDAAADHDGTIGVQANKYEAYVVWINSLIQGAGGNILDPSTVEAGRDAKVTINSQAGKDAAAVIEKLAKSTAKQPDFTTSNEGTSLGAMFPAQGAGEFMTNWTFVYKNYEGLIGKPGGPKDKAEFEDLGWAKYPETVEGQESRPPIGGIDIGVGAYSKHPEFAQRAAVCVTDAKAQSELAINEGLMPSRQSVYDSDELKEAYPPDLLSLFSQSVDSGGPRPKSAFYSQISSALQSRWHSPTSVTAGTPKKSADFLNQILKGKALL
ncbi:extracellular solute-binding protein [Aeromicrobium wangtongii]|uniref:Extracellular solute-binding protein n=1 Tax=Aeromicrobium wangtongii TaxID=2969247 RepID=A0ABY5M9F3_9ACTN|nr:extracellular solute-binding protein [Aeromicrobium wangtongii]MCD9197270.1 extracellular solute-binding protein [Aeromicrobium wangtongii]UUP14765.1 extracellular solute-binding protein [Aeromicrobium wangtongii]